MRVEDVIVRKSPKPGARSFHDPDFKVLQHRGDCFLALSWSRMAVTLENYPIAVARPLPVIRQAGVVSELGHLAAGE